MGFVTGPRKGPSAQATRAGTSRRAGRYGRARAATVGACARAGFLAALQAHIDEHALDSELVAKVPINYAKKNRLLPLSSDGSTIVVAVADPSNYEALDDLHVLFARPIQPVVVPGEIMNEAINRAYDQATTTTAQDLMIDLEEERLDVVANELAQEPRDLLESEDAAPIIKLVNGLLSQAVKDRASDIHVEVFERDLVVRFRVDGMLYRSEEHTSELQSRL